MWPRLLFWLAILAGGGKELYDLWDYGLFSWSDWLYTALGALAIMVVIGIKRG